MKERWDDKVPCNFCDVIYTRRGLKSHWGSQRCADNIALVGSVKREIDDLKNTVCVGKAPILTVFAKALKARQQGRELQDLVGLVCVRTKLYMNMDGDWERKQEYWADHWVVAFYHKYLADKRFKLYDDLVILGSLAPEEQDMHKQLMLLKYTDIHG